MHVVFPKNHLLLTRQIYRGTQKVSAVRWSPATGKTFIVSHNLQGIVPLAQDKTHSDFISTSSHQQPLPSTDRASRQVLASHHIYHYTIVYASTHSQHEAEASC